MPATIAIVGAGRLGRAIGRNLREREWRIGAVATRSFSSSRAAVRSMGGGYPLNGINSRVLHSDIVLLATPDDAIQEVAAKLAHIGGEEWQGKIVIHTSGALDESVLAPLSQIGAAVGSMHPLQTFIGRGSAPLEGVAFVIQGDLRAKRAARRIARALGGVPIALRSELKPAYHAAGTFASPYVLAVIEAAMSILVALGFSRRRAKMALLPLIHQTLANFERFGTREACSGALARGDFSTVARHKAALAHYSNELQQAYAALAELSVRLLAADPESALQRLDRILKKTEV